MGMSLEETKEEKDHEIKLSDFSVIMDDVTSKRLEESVLDYIGISFVVRSKDN